MKKSLIITLALVLCMSAFFIGCGSGSAKVEKSYWSVKSFVDTTYGAELDVQESYQLNISGNNYQLTRAKRTTMDVWMDMPFYGSLFGTFTVAESGDELVYTLSAPTRVIFANGDVNAVQTTMDPVSYDTDDKNTWPETLDGENATTKEAIIANAYSLVFDFPESVNSITVRVNKLSGEILGVTAA